MVELSSLPYFDYLLDRLATGNDSIEKSFGRHVHWGFWPDPSRAVCDDDDYARAAERLTLELCQSGEIAAGEQVLDVGCGFGGTIAFLNERLDGMRLVGLNIDERQLERASRQVVARPGNSVDFTLGDACALPFADNSFDRVLVVECIFHFGDRERFFSEAFRVLRPGGTLALSDFVPAASFGPIARFFTEASALRRFQYFGRIDLRCSASGYRRLAARTGLAPLARRDITRQTLPTYLYLLNLLRRSAPIPGFTERAASIIPLLHRGARLGVVRYELLAFRKPFAQTDRSGIRRRFW